MFFCRMSNAIYFALADMAHNGIIHCCLPLYSAQSRVLFVIGARQIDEREAEAFFRL